MQVFLYYILLINACGLLIMLVDKENAKHHWPRIPEISLLMLALFGGSVGMLVGIYLFRHKTKKILFILGVVTAFCFNIALFFLFKGGAYL